LEGKLTHTDNLSKSATEIFYNLLNIEGSDKRELLEKLERESSEVYSEVLSLINTQHDSLTRLTKLVGIDAHCFLDDICFTGSNFEKYSVKEKIGQGGMGVVYAAVRQDNTYDQELAIKFIQPSVKDALGKTVLFQEAQLLALLNHPYITKVFDAGEYQGCIYIVMERIKGKSLHNFITIKKPNVKTRLELFIKICEAIEHSHQNQVLHADIKPDNVLIDENQNPKIFDFNITQKQHFFEDKTTTPLIALSKDFASPEQQKGDHLTQKSDVYSLGKLLLDMNEGCPHHFDLHEVIKKATEQSPENRYQSVLHLKEDVSSFLANRPISTKRNSHAYVLKKIIQRRPLSVFLATGLAMSILIFGVTVVQKNLQLEKEKILSENIMLELTNLVFYGKNGEHSESLSSMLELTRKRVISNPSLPQELKKKMILSILRAVPEKQKIALECQDDCSRSN
jgi:serine/threonine-protein kinase